MREDGLAPHRIVCHREPWSGHVRVLYGRINNSNGMVFAAQPAIFVPYHPGAVAPTMLELEIEEAQSLMDEIWNCGIRPTEGAGSAGAFAAQGKHLEDMRSLVFKGQMAMPIVPTPKP